MKILAIQSCFLDMMGHICHPIHTLMLTKSIIRNLLQLLAKLSLKDIADEALDDFESGLADDAPWQTIKLNTKLK